MGILIFILVLLILVLIHEFGHFIVAKLCKMEVEEFAFGFPPRLFSKKVGETDYIFNSLPLGGYVKIKGESFDEETYVNNINNKRSFIGSPKWIQLLVVLSGVAMNWVLAFVLLFIIAVGGHLTEVTQDNKATLSNINYYVTNVIKGSPVYVSGIVEGDTINNIYIDNVRIDMTSKDIILQNIKSNINKEIKINYTNRDRLNIDAIVSGVYGLSDNKEKAIGLSFEQFGEERLGFKDSIVYSYNKVIFYTKATIVGVYQVFSDLFTSGNVSDSVAGPIGIYSILSEGRLLGFDYLLSIVAILSISLAIFNMLPIPSLDGGRCLFILWEMLVGKRLNNTFMAYMNTIGFFLLMILMFVVIYKDIVKLF